MESRKSHSSLNAAIAFIVTALISSVLLIAAFVIFLGDIIGSHLLAMLLVGAICGVISCLIYSLSLRPIIKRLEEQISTIYQVAYGARHAYEWTLEYITTRIFRG